MPQSTLKRYMGLLQALFLYNPLPAWSTNLGQRLIKSPKVLLSDTGLLAHLSGATQDRFRQDPILAGHLLENFVAMELVKRASWSETQVQFFHFRTLGDRSGPGLRRSGGARCRAGSEGLRHSLFGGFQGLRALAECAGEKFVRGNRTLYRARGRPLCEEPHGRAPSSDLGVLTA